MKTTNGKLLDVVSNTENGSRNGHAQWEGLTAIFYIRREKKRILVEN